MKSLISAAVAAVFACAGITASAQAVTDPGKPADDKPPATKPAATKPAATKPAVTKSAAKPADAKAAAKPAATKPASTTEKKPPAKKVEAKKPVANPTKASTAPKVVSSDATQTTVLYPNAKDAPKLQDRKGDPLPAEKEAYPVGSSKPKK